jgi:hypothetical protein
MTSGIGPAFLLLKYSVINSSTFSLLNSDVDIGGPDEEEEDDEEKDDDEEDDDEDDDIAQGAPFGSS